MVRNVIAVALAYGISLYALDARPEDASPTTVAAWREDLDKIVMDIRAFHPDPFTKIGKLTFAREAEKLKTDLPSLTEEERVVRAMQLVALIDDGHTRLLPTRSSFGFWYPFRIYEFTDGFFVTSAHRSVSDLAGAELLEIAGRRIREVAAKARSLMGADNEFFREERLYAIHNAFLMNGMGFAGPKGEMQARFKLRDGKVVDRLIMPSLADNPDFKGNEASFEWQFHAEMFGMLFGKADDWISGFQNLPASAFQTPDPERPPHLIGRVPFISRALPQYSGYYMQINQVDDYKLLQSVQKALAEVDQLRPRHLIVDLRYNPGGDGSKVAEIVDEFIKRKDRKVWGNLYVLTGRKTFSAAIMLLTPFLTYMDVSVVGEPAGAPLNSYGDATQLTYAHTGLRLQVSTRFWQLSASDDIRELVSVDVPAMFSFADYAAGRDPAVDPILRGDEMRALAVIASTEGGSVARRVWLARKERFAGYPWWLPPSETVLRQTCQALAAENRMTDALETCKLSTEIHPFNWHSWFNLGLVQYHMGKKQEAFASYQCVNKVDPNNHNAADIRQTLAKRGGDKVPESPDCPVH